VWIGPLRGVAIPVGNAASGLFSWQHQITNEVLAAQEVDDTGGDRQGMP